jgi:large subunit ribosomal protein L4
MLLTALLRQLLARELAAQAGAGSGSGGGAAQRLLATAAAAAAAGRAPPLQQQQRAPRLARDPWRRLQGAGVSTSAAAADAAAAAAAPTGAASAAAAAMPPAAPWPPAPGPDHLQSRRRGYAPPPDGLGRRTRRAATVDYPFDIAYFAPKPVFLYNLDGRVLARRELPGDVFNVPVRLDILHRVVRWQRAKAQQGTHKAKDRSEVSGGGRKPWQQKGSGRARQGSIRAPQWRGGGAAHGPVPRSHAHKLPKKVRRLGLRCALSAKAHEGRLLLLDSLRPEAPKTKVLAAKLSRLLAGRPRRSALLIDSAKDGADGGGALRLAGRNLEGVDIVPVAGANVYAILRRDVLLMTEAAAAALAARLRAPINRLGAAGRAHEARMRAAAQARAAAGGGGGGGGSAAAAAARAAAP